MDEEEKEMKTLIVYFSWSGNTERIVKEVNAKCGYDLLRIEREKPYSTNYEVCAYQEAKEEWEKKTLPPIKEITIDVNSYGRILLFFPIWWYTMPMPIATFIKQELKGFKGEAWLFANSYTNDPHYMENCFKNAREMNADLILKKGLFNKSSEEHIAFIKENER